MGKDGRGAPLIAPVVFAAAAAAGALEGTDSPLVIVAEAGTPFSSVRGRWTVLDRLQTGPRFDLVERAALRTGLETRVVYYEGSTLSLFGDLFLARAFGLAGTVSTWDAELNEWARIAFDARWSGALRLGAIGYHGAEASQGGVLGLFALCAGYRLDAWFDLGAEIGWIGDLHAAKPLAAFTIEHHF